MISGWPKTAVGEARMMSHLADGQSSELSVEAESNRSVHHGELASATKLDQKSVSIFNVRTQEKRRTA